MVSDIDRPIFIVAPHRSGTTLLYETLARHPELAWLNRFNKRFPAWPRLAWALTRVRGDDRPMECQPVWDRFRTRDDDVMGPEDATPRATAWTRHVVGTTTRLRRRPRFVAKYPRLSLRVPWLDALFPDALFVHVTRDWRAVVNSTVNRKRKREARGGGWFGIRVPGWRAMAELPHEVAATRQFVVATHALEEAAVALPGRVHRFSYEAFCQQPVPTMRRLLEQLELAWSGPFEASLPSHLRSGNVKWPAQLGVETVEKLRAEDPALLSRYEVGPPPER